MKLLKLNISKAEPSQKLISSEVLFLDREPNVRNRRTDNNFTYPLSIHISLSVSLLLQSSTHEHDPEKLELLNLGQEIIPLPEC